MYILIDSNGKLASEFAFIHKADAVFCAMQKGLNIGYISNYYWN